MAVHTFDQAVDILTKLISFDTTSKNSNLALLAYIQDYLSQYGIESEFIKDPVLPKANLFATILGQTLTHPNASGESTLDKSSTINTDHRADGIAKPDIAKLDIAKTGIVLSGHTDTVPITGQTWTYDAYKLSLNNHRYYGRGTADMKGFLACVLACVPQMVKANLTIPIHLAFSYDEEIGCVGVRHLIEHLQTQAFCPAVCIIGEPTQMQVATAHKGKVSFEVTVIGKECHSGMAPDGVNAINYAARLVVWLEQLAKTKQHQGPFDDTYAPPFTTVHTGVIKGGTALNIVPNQCTFKFEIRNIAKEDPQTLIQAFQSYVNELEEEMQSQDAACRIKITQNSNYPGLLTDGDEYWVKLIQDLADNSTTTINFGTEGGLFSQHFDMATVVCGPGSMQQGHKPDEYLEDKQLTQCLRFLDNLIRHVSSP